MVEGVWQGVSWYQHYSAAKEEGVLLPEHSLQVLPHLTHDISSSSHPRQLLQICNQSKVSFTNAIIATSVDSNNIITVVTVPFQTFFNSIQPFMGFLGIP